MRNWLNNLKPTGSIDPVHIATILTLAIALLFGGGGAQGPFQNGIIITLSIFLLAMVFFGHFTGRRPLPTIALWPALLLVGLLLLGIFQLSAVPNAPWLEAPGRAIEVQLLPLLGNDLARPLSIDTEATNRALTAFILPFALLLAALNASRAQVRTYLFVMVGAAVVHAFIGVLQVGLGYPAHLDFYGGRVILEPRGGFANSNHFGTMLTLGIIALAALRIMQRKAVHHGSGSMLKQFKRLDSWLALLLVAIFSLLVLVAGTRAGMVLLVIALPIFMSTFISKFSPRASIGVVALLVVALVAGGFLSPHADIFGTASKIWDSDDVRFAILPDLTFIISSFGIWGIGLGGFDGAFRANENLDLVGPYFVNHAHNDWIEWVIETGLPGAILLGATLLIIIGLSIRAWLGARRRSSLDGGLVMIAAAGLAAVALHSVVDYPARMTAIAACIAILIAVAWLGWTEKKPDPVERGPMVKWAIGIGCFAVAALLSVMVMRLHAAEAAYVEGRPSAAVALNPKHGQALAAIASRTEQEDEEAAADVIPVARRALLERPYSANAVRSLAVALEVQGEPRNAFWPIAAALGWRDAPSQRWAFLQALDVGQFDVAALRADALMRTNNVSDNFKQTLWQLGLVPEFREAMVKRLLLNPSWRREWLADGPSSDDRTIGGAIAYLDDLGAQGTLSRYEMRGTLERLVSAGQAGDALRLKDALSDDMEMAGLWDDGGFDRDPELYQRKLTPFDWNMRSGGGYLAQVEGRGNPRVYVEADGQGGYPLIDRIMGVPPGDYRITFEAEQVNGDIAAISATTICLGANTALATMRLEEGENSLGFTIPADCEITAFAVTARVSDDYVGALLDNFTLQRNN